MYLNRVTLFGNLTRDPELRTLPSGSYVATFALATNRTYKDKNGAKQEDVQFHNVVVFARQAEVLAQYARKGSSLYVEGRLQTRSWDDKADGTKKYRTEVVVENFQFGPRSSGGAQGSTAGAGFSSPSGNVPKSAPVTAVPTAELDTIEYPNEDINPEDIPF